MTKQEWLFKIIFDLKLEEELFDEISRRRLNKIVSPVFDNSFSLDCDKALTQLVDYTSSVVSLDTSKAKVSKSAKKKKKASVEQD